MTHYPNIISNNTSEQDEWIDTDPAKVRYLVGDDLIHVILPELAKLIDERAGIIAHEHLNDTPVSRAVLREYMLTELAGVLAMTSYNRDETVQWAWLEDWKVMQSIGSFPPIPGDEVP